MALPSPSSQPDRKRVKVYELRANDWFDRGTGFCTGTVIDDEARIHVQSEEDPSKVLLEIKISKDDGYQKQQDTLIVWTESSGTDMALSFQEAEGCGVIWTFVSECQRRLGGMAPGGQSTGRKASILSGSSADDSLSDEALEGMQAVMLPPPDFANLPDIENMMRIANNSVAGRDALTKFVLSAEYVAKLIPLVKMAEDNEDLTSLHRLCNIMKTLILLNDTAIIETVVMDELILGVVGALEYDPDFPSHKANHRQYLSDGSRFKEVVKIEDENIKKKIHFTYRLQYLKDVVLARILDDPTFSVLNSLIYFNQIDIVTHLQQNTDFFRSLFGLFAQSNADESKRKDAVLFIQNTCGVAKTLQAQQRAQLYSNLISNGLFMVITFALRHHYASVRVAGTDILVALIDHDAMMIRGQIFRAINDKQKPLTDTLIELLLVEVDLGVKAQMADAIKVLLDPNVTGAGVEGIMGRANSDYLVKLGRGASGAPSQTDAFIQTFYDDSAKKLFQPLQDLKTRESLDNLTIHEVNLYTYLVEILSFFVRSHTYRCKFFVVQEQLATRVAQLMGCPEKHLKLIALKYFRTCIALHDDTYTDQIVNNRLLEPILTILFDTMPRDNLLNSACLEFFEFVRHENIRAVVFHLVENYREKLEKITYVDVFQDLISRYEQQKHAQEQLELHDPNASYSSVDTEPASLPAERSVLGNGGRWQGLQDADAEEQEYFDKEDADEDGSFIGGTMVSGSGGESPMRPLVDYPDDDEDAMNILASDAIPEVKAAHPVVAGHTTNGDSLFGPILQSQPQDSPEADVEMDAVADDKDKDKENKQQQAPTPPPERMAEKRRREEDEEEDELAKMSHTIKRRGSAASISSQRSATSAHRVTGDAGGDADADPLSTSTATDKESQATSGSPPGAVQQQTHFLRRKKAFGGKDVAKEAAAAAAAMRPKKINISFGGKVGGTDGGGGVEKGEGQC